MNTNYMLSMHDMWTFVSFLSLVPFTVVEHGDLACFLPSFLFFFFIYLKQSQIYRKAKYSTKTFFFPQ